MVVTVLEGSSLAMVSGGKIYLSSAFPHHTSSPASNATTTHIYKHIHNKLAHVYTHTHIPYSALLPVSSVGDYVTIQ